MFRDGFPPDETRMIQAARELEGETVCDREITDAHLNELIFPAIDNLYDLMDELRRRLPHRRQRAESALPRRARRLRHFRSGHRQ